MSERPIPTYEEKLAGFDRLLATPTLTVEERWWVEKFREFLVMGCFHQAWGCLRVQIANLEDLIASAVTKARQHAPSS